MPNSSQVIDIDSGGNYVKDQASGINEYMGHMLKVQKLIVDKFGIKARKMIKLAGMSDMLKNSVADLQLKTTKAIRMRRLPS